MKIKESTHPYATEASAAKSSPPTRITVRLKPELAQKVDAARRARNVSATAVIEQALKEHLETKVVPGKLSLLDAFRKHGLLGTVDLGPETMIDRKGELTEYLADKHGPR